MSNLRNTTRLPLRSSTTNKGKAHASTNDLLERKTRALEGGLNKLKLTTQRDQTKSTMDIYRRVKLISQYSHDKPKSVIKCGQCEKDEADMKCLECVEVYCSNCYTQFHLRGALQRHHGVLLSTAPKKNPTLNTDESGEVENEKTDAASFQQSFLQWREDNINRSKRTQQKRGLASPTQNRIDYSTKLPYLDSNSLRTNSNENFLLKKSRSAVNQNNQQVFNQRPSRRDQPKVNVRVRIHHSLSDHTSLVDMVESSNDDIAIARTVESTELIPLEENFSHAYNLAQIEEQERPVTHISAKSLSRPTSSSIKKDFAPSRSNSVTLPEKTLRSNLATKSTEELEAIMGTKLNLSRASSAHSENSSQPTSWRPSQSTSNNINAQSIIIDQKTIAQFDSVLDDLFDESKIELAYQLDSTRDQPSARISGNNSTTVTPGRHSPFSFSNSLYKMSRINSATSRDTVEGGFFTDVLPRPVIPPASPPPLPPLVLPAPILECSTSNEWKNTSENQLTEFNPIPLPKLDIPSLSRTISKHEDIAQQTKTQIDNDSRPGSSLSSSSLPISVTSSKPGNSKAQSSTTSSRKSSSSTIDNSSSTPTVKNSTSTTAKDTSSSSSTTAKDTSSPSSATTAKDTSSSSSSAAAATKTSSAPTATSNETTTSSTSNDTSSVTTTTKSSSATTLKPTLENSTFEPELLITKDSPLDATDDSLQESRDLLDKRSPLNAQISEDPIDSTDPISTAYLTREININENDLPIQKKVRRKVPRQPTTNDESSHFRKLEFSVGDGVKWQEASMESLSSTKTIVSKQSSALPTPHALSPFNPINTELAEQFSKYDNDDGRSSAAYQNMNDEECFHQLCQELSSELDIKGSDEDAPLNEHILKILQSIQRPFHEKDLPMIETQLKIMNC